jgi:cell division protein FtsQ
LSANSMDLPSDASPILTVDLPRRGWVLALALAVVVVASATWVAGSPVFRLRELRVIGARHLSQADVRRLSGLSPSTNVLWISGSDLVRRLEHNPWVRSASIARHLPATIVVSIRERVPVARVAVPGGGFVEVSSDGVVLPARGARAAEPILVRANPPMGPAPRAAALAGLGSALRAVAALPATVRVQVSSATELPDGTVTLKLERGTIVSFGDASQATEKGRVLRSLLVWSSGHGVVPATIDLQSPSAPALVPA